MNYKELKVTGGWNIYVDSLKLTHKKNWEFEGKETRWDALILVQKIHIYLLKISLTTTLFSTWGKNSWIYDMWENYPDPEGPKKRMEKKRTKTSV